MKSHALIIFVRNPVPGKVKTRISEKLGDTMALAIYRELLEHTQAITKNLRADKFVFYSNYTEAGDVWNDGLYFKLLQTGDTLGNKMKDAFSCIFGKGYKKVVIIGSDCFELTKEIIEKAFEALHEKDVVIGPAKDGGYYLLGMKKMIPEIFDNKVWSSSSVYKNTIADFEKAGNRYAILPMLNDVDTAEDVPAEMLNLKIKE